MPLPVDEPAATGHQLTGLTNSTAGFPSGEAAITTIGLRRTFDGGVALHGLDLELGRGEILVLLGPNGAGKTTTIRLLNGVLVPDSGRATVLGLDPVRDGDSVRSRTGVLTENAGLDDRLTARENLRATGTIRGMNASILERRIDELLDRFGVGDLADRRTHGFSTGQRKRVALARALLHDPEVLFLDEPTSGLDPAATREVTSVIGSLAAEHGRTIVLCTHFLGEAGRLPARMAVLDHGRLVACGWPDDLAARLWSGLRVEVELSRPADDRVARTLMALGGVRSIAPTDAGATLVVDERAVVPRVVAELVEGGVDVFGATIVRPTLEDVYFEIQRRAGGAEPPEPRC